MERRPMQFYSGPPEYLLNAVTTGREAVRYLEAGKLLSTLPDEAQRSELLAPTLFLLSHAVELGIKSHLILKQVVTKKFEHQLRRLLEAAEASRLVVDSAFREAVEVMAETHGHHRFRYPQNAGFSYYPAPTLIEKIEGQIRRTSADVASQAEVIHRGTLGWVVPGE